MRWFTTSKTRNRESNAESPQNRQDCNIHISCKYSRTTPSRFAIVRCTVACSVNVPLGIYGISLMITKTRHVATMIWLQRNCRRKVSYNEQTGALTVEEQKMQDLKMKDLLRLRRAFVVAKKWSKFYVLCAPYFWRMAPLEIGGSTCKSSPLPTYWPSLVEILWLIFHLCWRNKKK